MDREERLENLLVNVPCELAPFDKMVWDTDILTEVGKEFYPGATVLSTTAVGYTLWKASLDNGKEFYVKKIDKEAYGPTGLWEVFGLHLNNLLTDQATRYLYDGQVLITEGILGVEPWSHPPEGETDVEGYAFAYGKWRAFTSALGLCDRRPPNMLWDGEHLRNIDFESLFFFDEEFYCGMPVKQLIYEDGELQQVDLADLFPPVPEELAEYDAVIFEGAKAGNLILRENIAHAKEELLTLARACIQSTTQDPLFDGWKHSSLSYKLQELVESYS